MTTVLVKVWLGGEGSNEIGNRDYPKGSEVIVGVVEALLVRLEPAGWLVDGATRWSHIKKYSAGAALREKGHGDITNVIRLVNDAYEAGCEVVAFVRDVDSDPDREQAIETGIARARALFASVNVIGGPAIPALDGWILALEGHREIEAMSRKRCLDLLATHGYALKDPDEYVAAVERHDLTSFPPGACALEKWVSLARAVMSVAIRGTAAP
jgi:hypothetical protein